MSLNNLAARLTALGRGGEALVPVQEAVELRRALTRQNPDAFKPAFPGSLNNLALCLSELGRREEALAPAQEAVDLYRALARQNPHAFRPDLAMSLGSLSRVMSRMNRHREATATLVEGICLLQPQFTRLPEPFAPLMGELVRHYREASRAAGAEPDLALLAPIAEILQRLERGEHEST